MISYRLSLELLFLLWFLFIPPFGRPVSRNILLFRFNIKMTADSLLRLPSLYNFTLRGIYFNELNAAFAV